MVWNEFPRYPSLIQALCLGVFAIGTLFMYYISQTKVSLMIVFKNYTNCWTKRRKSFPHAWSDRLLKDWELHIYSLYVVRLNEIYTYLWWYTDVSAKTKNKKSLSCGEFWLLLLFLLFFEFHNWRFRHGFSISLNNFLWTATGKGVEVEENW